MTIYKGNFFEDIRVIAYGGMCDYTHTGTTQIARSFNQEKGTIELDFNDNLILHILNDIYKLMKIFSLTYFEEAGLKQKKITMEAIENFNNSLEAKK